MLFWLGKSDERFKRERIRWSNISIQYGRKHLFKGSEVTKLIIPSYKKFLPLLHSFVAVSIEVFEISEILEKVELCTSASATGLNGLITVNREGIMSKPVTVHLFSQKVNESLGAVPVGIGESEITCRICKYLTIINDLF